VLIDSGHSVHAEQTQALLAHALQGRALGRLVNTHLHSDHCGGNATLQRAYGVPLSVPPGQADAVARWDRRGPELPGHRPAYRPLPRTIGLLVPGEAVRAGGRDWEVITAPGHDPTW
jgi:glyoxylase-like metal-dependent hydrolase (beta-lactamase superfamily II)